MHPSMIRDLGIGKHLSLTAIQAVEELQVSRIHPTTTLFSHPPSSSHKLSSCEATRDEERGRCRRWAGVLLQRSYKWTFPPLVSFIFLMACVRTAIGSAGYKYS